MQRIGRVNRIGSKADRIYVYNYYPSAHGDAQIHLVNNALRKLQAFHTAFGEDNKVFSILEEKGEGALFGNKIQKEESEILKYLNELRDFRKNCRWRIWLLAPFAIGTAPIVLPGTTGITRRQGISWRSVPS